MAPNRRLVIFALEYRPISSGIHFGVPQLPIPIGDSTWGWTHRFAWPDHHPNKKADENRFRTLRNETCQGVKDAGDIPQDKHVYIVTCVYIHISIHIYNIYTYVLYIHYKHTNIQTYIHTYIYILYIHIIYIYTYIYVAVFIYIPTNPWIEEQNNLEHLLVSAPQTTTWVRDRERRGEPDCCTIDEWLNQITPGVVLTGFFIWFWVKTLVHLWIPK